MYEVLINIVVGRNETYTVDMPVRGKVMLEPKEGGCVSVSLEGTQAGCALFWYGGPTEDISQGVILTNCEIIDADKVDKGLNLLEIQDRIVQAFVSRGFYRVVSERDARPVQVPLRTR